MQFNKLTVELHLLWSAVVFPGSVLISWIPVLWVFEFLVALHYHFNVEREYLYCGCLNKVVTGLCGLAEMHEYLYCGCLNASSSDQVPWSGTAWIPVLQVFEFYQQRKRHSPLIMNTRIIGVWIKDYRCVSWQRLWSWIPVLRVFESSQRCTPGRPLCTWIPVLRVFELNRGEHMLNGLLHEYPYYGCLNWINRDRSTPFTQHEYPYYGCLNYRRLWER